MCIRLVSMQRLWSLHLRRERRTDRVPRTKTHGVMDLFAFIYVDVLLNKLLLILIVSI